MLTGIALKQVVAVVVVDRAKVTAAAAQMFQSAWRALKVPLSY